MWYAWIKGGKARRRGKWTRGEALLSSWLAPGQTVRLNRFS